MLHDVTPAGKGATSAKAPTTPHDDVADCSDTDPSLVPPGPAAWGGSRQVTLSEIRTAGRPDVSSTGGYGSSAEWVTDHLHRRMRGKLGSCPRSGSQ